MQGIWGSNLELARSNIYNSHDICYLKSFSNLNRSHEEGSCTIKYDTPIMNMFVPHVTFLYVYNDIVGWSITIARAPANRAATSPPHIAVSLFSLKRLLKWQKVSFVFSLTRLWICSVQLLLFAVFRLLNVLILMRCAWGLSAAFMS